MNEQYDDGLNWQYRIVRFEISPNEYTYSIQECLFDIDDILVAHTIDLMVESSDTNDINNLLKEIGSATSKPIVSELVGSGGPLD